MPVCSTKIVETHECKSLAGYANDGSLVQRIARRLFLYSNLRIGNLMNGLFDFLNGLALLVGLIVVIGLVTLVYFFLN